MDAKTIWVFLFILIIIFVLTDTLDLPVITGSFKADVIGKDGFQKDVVEKPLSLVQTPTTPNTNIYKAFEVSDLSLGDSITFIIPYSWIKSKEISPKGIKVFSETPSGWEEAKTKSIDYNNEIQYEIINFSRQSTGLFIITWDQNEPLPVKKKSGISFPSQLGILIVIIVVLLFLIYHSVSVKESRRSRQNATLQKLEDYLKKSLLEGYDEKEVRTALINAGWDPAVVDQGIKRIRYF